MPPLAGRLCAGAVTGSASSERMSLAARHAGARRSGPRRWRRARRPSGRGRSQVVEREEPDTGSSRAEEVPEVGAREAPAGGAGARRVERLRGPRGSGVADDDQALPGEGLAVRPLPRRQHAVEEVDADARPRRRGPRAARRPSGSAAGRPGAAPAVERDQVAHEPPRLADARARRARSRRSRARRSPRAAARRRSAYDPALHDAEERLVRSSAGHCAARDRARPSGACGRERGLGRLPRRRVRQAVVERHAGRRRRAPPGSRRALRA